MLVKRDIEDGKCVGVIIKHIGPRQNLTGRFITKSIKEGWMSWENGLLKIHATPPVYMEVIRSPGYYVVFDPLRWFQTMGDAQDYQMAHWPGKESDDPQVPSGIKNLTCYELKNLSYDETYTPQEQKKDFMDKFLDFLLGD